MFRRILHANNGSKPAFQALRLVLAIARQNNSDLHMVSVQEIDYIPEFIEEVRQQADTAARRFHLALERACAMAEESHVKLHTHVLVGRPVRTIIQLTAELKVDLLVIGSRDHSSVYERLVRVGLLASRSSRNAPYWWSSDKWAHESRNDG
jgi:nucleotide-binding universal stress UspA family protein